MTLSERQRAFTRMAADLIQFAYESGYELTFGDAFRDPRLHGEFGKKDGYGAAKSVHKVRLAIDLNLWVNGEYVTTSDHYGWDALHKYWESLGGSKRVPNDANHFSMEYQGCR